MKLRPSPPSLLLFLFLRYTRAQAYLVGHCASLADAARAGELDELLARARAEAAAAVRARPPPRAARSLSRVAVGRLGL